MQQRPTKLEVILLTFLSNFLTWGGNFQLPLTLKLCEKYFLVLLILLSFSL